MSCAENDRSPYPVLKGHGEACRVPIALGDALVQEASVVKLEETTDHRDALVPQEQAAVLDHAQAEPATFRPTVLYGQRMHGVASRHAQRPAPVPAIKLALMGSSVAGYVGLLLQTAPLAHARHQINGDH